MLSTLLVATSLQVPVLSLERGGPGDSDFRYWACQDTFIDSTRTNDNFGRDPLLSGGPGKTILIQFGDLRRVVGVGRRVARARLILTQEIGDAPQLGGAFRVLTPWGEGPGRRGLGLLGTTVEPGAKSPNVSATWDSPLGGLKNPRWQATGAKGPSDRDEIRSASAVRNENQLVIDGLGSTVQAMMDDPTTNFGFALDFKNVVDFSSSEATSGRPILQIETEEAPIVKAGDLQILYVSCSVDLKKARPKDGELLTWTAHFRYNGPGSTGAMRVVWNADDREIISEIPGGIKDGEEGTASVQWPWRSNDRDHRTRPVLVKAEMGPGDANRANNSVRFLEASVPILVLSRSSQMDQEVREAVTFLNDVAIPMSRFSFAVDGIKTGVRIQSLERVPSSGGAGALPLRDGVRNVLRWAGVPDLSRTQISQADGADRLSTDPFPGLTGGGDTRNDEAYPSILGFPTEPWYDAATAQLRFESTDLLSATEAAILQGRMKDPTADLESMTPKNTVLRLLDGSGQLIRGARLEFYGRQGGKFTPTPAFMIENFEGGVGPLPNQGRTPFPDFEDGVLMVRVSRGGASATGFIKSWQLIDSFARGNTDAGILPLRVPLPPTKPGELNLAEGRILSDSFDTLPSKLDAIIDGRSDTTYNWPAGKAGFIEIDLQKDRAVSKIELEFADGKIWNQFKLNIFSTGQKPEAARTWTQEIAGSWMLANRGDNGKLSYYGSVAQVRYIRIEIPEGTNGASLAGWKVFGLD